jgi:hypothetical protein
MNAKASDAYGAMWSVNDWARKWGISERQAHTLRKHPRFPLDATVVLGSRCVRFRATRLEEFAATLAAESQCIAEPKRLRDGRARAVQSDPGPQQPSQ